MKNGNKNIKFLRFNTYMTYKFGRFVSNIYETLNNINKKSLQMIYKNLKYICDCPIKLYHLFMIKKYPYSIEIDNEITDIISSFLLDGSIEYPKEIVDYLNNKIYIIDTNYYDWNLSRTNIAICNVSIKPEITNNYDFYVYSTTYNKKFMFCFNDKKQFSKFKLIYGG